MPPRRSLTAASLAFGLVLAAGSQALAQPFWHRHRCESCVAGICHEHYHIPYQHPADAGAEAYYYANDTLRRAGNPQCLSHHAAPSTTPNYSGYYVGGGSAHGGGPRCVEEGTWGWDYVGGHLPRHVYLRWTHGRRDQGGTGSYKVDGPEVPNVFNALKPRAHRNQDP
ncbi:MAG TPA: hypothetical protein VGZ22_16625 [Isosphaeraceae bacterium]|jgi:hypothetical protein|nr:hypothetical protein [Isosphaeraceae bacterium]